jgi:phosphate:Na+ symporter
MLTHFIQNTPPEVADAALEAFKKEILHQYVETRYYLIRLYNLSLPLKLAHSQEPSLQPLFKGSLNHVYGYLKELHGNIFEYYSMIDTKQLDETETQKLDQYLRASRNIMNATQNLKEVRSDLEEFELSNNSFLNEQFPIFKKRLNELFSDLDAIVDNKKVDSADLDNTLEQVNSNDMKCISESSQAIKNRKLKDIETTSLVMTNRMFTQSCRMFVFGIKGING